MKGPLLPMEAAALRSVVKAQSLSFHEFLSGMHRDSKAPAEGHGGCSAISVPSTGCPRAAPKARRYRQAGLPPPASRPSPRAQEGDGGKGREGEPGDNLANSKHPSGADLAPLPTFPHAFPRSPACCAHRLALLSALLSVQQRGGPGALLPCSTRSGWTRGCKGHPSAQRSGELGPWDSRASEGIFREQLRGWFPAPSSSSFPQRTASPQNLRMVKVPIALVPTV